MKILPRIERYQRFQVFLARHKLEKAFLDMKHQELRNGLERATRKKYQVFWVMIALYALLFSSVITTALSGVSFFRGIGDALMSLSGILGNGLIVLTIYISHRIMGVYDIEQSFYISAIIAKIMNRADRSPDIDRPRKH